MQFIALPRMKKAKAPRTALREAKLARQVLRAEAAAVAGVPIDRAFHRAVQLVARTVAPRRPGLLVVSGLGKSGLIGRKLSATFASTGTPSHFMHPVEAMHGDLGRVRRGDVVLLLSYGGSTQEVVALATLLRQDNVPVIALVGSTGSDLAKVASVTLTVGDVNEACPHNLAPTASTAAMLALGDALALCVSQRRGFGVEDFRRVHPGGSLGRQLLRVVEVMRFKARANLPLIPRRLTVEQAYRCANEFKPHIRRAGALVVTEPDGRLAGIFTDGDLRRLVLERGRDLLTARIDSVMTVSPRRLPHTALVRDAVQMVREFRIDEIPVVDAKQRVVGLIDVQDLMALKVIEG